MDLQWDLAPLTLKDAIKENRLPVVTKVNDACEIAGGKSLKKGELLTIHGRRNIVKFHGFDNTGCEIFIPASAGLKARLRVPADSVVFNTVKDICLENPSPKFVEITQDREHGGQQGSALKVGDRLKVLLVERNGDGPTHMHFRNQFGKHVRLPADFEGPFKPCSEDNKIHSLLDLSRQPLPFTIEVVHDSDCQTSWSKITGIVQIIDVLKEEIALASIRHKKIYAVVFPTDADLSVLLPENQNSSIYEELTEAQASFVDVHLLEGYIDNHCFNTKVSTCYTPYETISQMKLTKKERRFTNLKTSSLGHRHDLKLHPIKAASKLLKSKKKTPSEEEDKKETKTKVSKTKSLRKFKDKMRKKSENADPRLNGEQVPASPDSEDRCSVTSSPSPQEDRRITSINESDGEIQREDSRDSDSDDYAEPNPASPVSSKAKTNTLIGRMWKKMRVQKSKSAGSNDEGAKDSTDNKTQSSLISGELYESLDEGLYEEIETHMRYESLDFVQEARRTMGLPPPPPASSAVENSGDSGFLDLQRSGGRHSNSPLPPLPPNHPLEQRSYSNEDIYEESIDLPVVQQVDSAHFQAFFETAKRSEQEISEWSSEELAKFLHKLQLSQFVGKFHDSQIDGGLLIELDEAVFKDFGMNTFQSRKLRKFVFGWRPDDLKSGSIAQQPKASDDDPTTWNGVEVVKRLASIGMNDVAKFCKSNQVNGDLLKDIVVDDEIMDEIVSGADKRLKLIKLRNYVIDAWRPRLKSEASVLSDAKRLKKIKTDEIDIGERKASVSAKKAGSSYVAPVVPSNHVTSSASSGSRIASIKQQLMMNKSS